MTQQFHAGIDLHFGCPRGLSEAWKAQCQLPLFPGRWNTWTMIRQVSDGVELSSLPDKAAAALRYWLSEGAAIPGVTWGNVDQFSAEVLPGATSLFLSPAEMGDRQMAASLASCVDAWDTAHPEHKVGLKGKEEGEPLRFALVVVRFVYRGSAPFIPWPAVRQTEIPTLVPPHMWATLPGVVLLTAGVPKLTEWCPTGADWLVTAAYAPPVEEAVPAEGGLTIGGVKLPRFTAPLEEPVRKVGDAATKLVWIVGVGAGVVLLTQLSRALGPR